MECPVRSDLVAVPRALLVQLHDHYCGPERSDPVADPLWTELGAYLDGRAELPDRYTKLAHAMDCTEAEVPHRIQEHAPWNGRPHCEDAERERKAAANLFRPQCGTKSQRDFNTDSGGYLSYPRLETP